MATQTRQTFDTRIDIPENAREELVALLNARLADTFDLYSQLKQAHWNVKGSDFIQLHLLYDQVAESVLEYVDEIAERATALGGLALGTARLAAAHSSLEEYPLGAVDGMDTVAAVADRLAAYGASVRAAIDASTERGDLDTADLFTEVSRGIDKHLWFVEAHLQS
jgi:starvation-inducible DNA-binding protein